MEWWIHGLDMVKISVDPNDICLIFLFQKSLNCEWQRRWRQLVIMIGIWMTQMIEMARWWRKWWATFVKIFALQSIHRANLRVTYCEWRRKNSQHKCSYVSVKGWKWKALFYGYNMRSSHVYDNKRFNWRFESKKWNRKWENNNNNLNNKWTIDMGITCI